MLLIIAIIVSFIPFFGVYLWLRNGVAKEEAHRKLCDRTLMQGFLTMLPVLLMSLIFNVLIALTGVKTANPLLYQALYTFIVLALSEEIAKFWMTRRFMKKQDSPYSWLDVTILFTIVATGFGILEAVIYSIGASIPVVLIRGICVPHVSYGFLVGFFYGKGLKTGNTITKWTGFAIAWLIHGLYDFSLSDEFLAINENIVIVPFLLAFADIVLAVILIVFTRKARKREKYTTRDILA